MGKDRFLDACYKTFTVTLMVMLLSSCRMPRIAILTDPLTPEEHLRLGQTYESKGEYAPALVQYESAAKDLPVAYLYIGNLRFQSGQYQDAEAAYKKAIEKTEDPRAFNNLAWLYYTTDRELAKAEELAEKAVELVPDSEDFMDTLNKIREKRGNSRPSP